MADGFIDIDVKLNGSPAERQADALGKKLGQQVQQGVDSANKATETSTKQALNNIGGTLTAFGAAYTKSVTLPIAAAAVATGASAVKIDTALTGVRKTVDGTEQQYEALKDAAIEFSKTNAVDPAQILDIQALGAQLGYSIEELDKFGEVVSGLDIATNMGAEQAAMELAAFSNIMNMSHDDVDRYGSTIVDLGNHFATTEADISSMAQRIAGAGKQIGMSEADVLGMATALSSMGISAEAGGTAISTIMSNIDKAVATGGEKLETWAATAKMSADEFANAWKSNPTEALSMVLAGMDAATEEGGNMSLMLEELGINAIRQTDTLKRLANNVDMLPNAVSAANKAWDENTALTKEVENRNNSMAAQLQILWNKVQAVATEVGEPLMKALIGVLDAADPLIEAIASGAQAFADMDEESQQLILAAIGIVAAFGPLNSIVGKTLQGVGKFSEGWDNLSKNLKTVRTNIANSTSSMIANANAASKSAEAMGKYRTVGTGAAQMVVKYDEATKKATVVQSQNVTATKAQTVAMKASSVATKAGAAAQTVMSTAMKVGASAARLLGNALKTIAPMLAIAAIAEFVNLLGQASERSKQFTKATDGIRKAGDAYSEAYGKAASSMSDAAKKADSYAESLSFNAKKAQEVIEKQAELADSITETWSEAGTNAAMVDIYADTIERLTNKYDENGNKARLTASEEAELAAAVDGLNSIMGTSYKVVDSQNGILNVNTTEILKNADAWNKKALAEAASAVNTDLMKQKIETQRELNKATEQLNKATKAMNETNDPQEWLAASESAKHYQGIVDNLTDAVDAIDGEIADNNRTVQEMTEAYEQTSAAISSVIDQNSAWSESLANAGIDASAFASSLSDIGISATDLTQIMQTQGQEGIDGFIAAYQGGTQELASWLETNGYKIPEGMASGIESGKPASDKAAAAVEQAAETALSSLPAQDIGNKISAKYASGVGSNSNQSEQGGKSQADAAAKGMQSQNDNAHTWGSHLGNLFASGIRAARDAVSSAGEFLAGIVKNILGHTVAKEGPLHEGGKGEWLWGLHMVQNIADGMTSQQAKRDIRDASKEVAVDLSKELQREMANIEPMAQLQASITQGNSALNMSSMMVGAAPSYTTNNQNLAFYGDYQSPDIIAREMRMQQRYGLAGQNA